MLLMGMALVGGSAVWLVGTSLLPLDQEVGTHASAAGAVLGIGLMAAAVNPAGNIGWGRAGLLLGFCVGGFAPWRQHRPGRGGHPLRLCRGGLRSRVLLRLACALPLRSCVLRAGLQPPADRDLPAAEEAGAVNRKESCPGFRTGCSGRGRERRQERGSR